VAGPELTLEPVALGLAGRPLAVDGVDDARHPGLTARRKPAERGAELGIVRGEVDDSVD